MRMNPFDLSGKVAIVTGGNGGIGLGIARELAEAGGPVALAACNEAKTRAAVEQLRAQGARALGVSVDVTDEASGQAMVRTAVAERGRLDILVNNAGFNVRKPPQGAGASGVGPGTRHRPHQHLPLQPGHLLGVQEGWRGEDPEHRLPRGALRRAVRGALQRGHGRHGPAHPQCLATAGAKDNIQVNAFHPGYTDTEFMRRAREEVPGLHDRVMSRSPVVRWSVPEDFAGLAVFLASLASNSVTGASICIDGGFSCP